MSAVATAIVGSAVVGAYASGEAADAQADAAENASANEMRMFNLSREDQKPWRDVGGAALNQLAAGLGLNVYPDGYEQNQNNFDAAAYLAANPDVAASGYWGSRPWDHYQSTGKTEGRAYTPTQQALAETQRAQSPGGSMGFGSLLRNFTAEDFQKEPGYEFRLAEGMKGITNSAAARGGLLSGAALKAAGRYNQDFASNEYGNAYNRWNNDKTQQYNRLASLAGVGQTAASQIGNQAVQTGQSISNNITGAGNARASGYVGMGNALTNSIGTGVNMWQQNQMLNRLNGGGYNGYVGNAYQNGFGDAFTNVSNPAYG